MEDAKKPYPITDDVWMVPCSVAPNKKFFKPVVRPFQDKKVNLEELKKQPWESSEEEVLKHIVLVKNSKNWSSISKEINSKVHKGLPVRNGKQCREHWANHLDPNLNKNPWSHEEDFIIIKQQIQTGNRWSDISKILKGRTENQVKNRWKSLWAKAKKECPSSININEYLLTNFDPKKYDLDADPLIFPSILAQSATHFPIPDPEFKNEEFNASMHNFSIAKSEADYFAVSRNNSGNSNIDFFNIDDRSISRFPSYTSDCNIPMLNNEMLMNFGQNRMMAFQPAFIPAENSTVARDDSYGSGVDNLFASFNNIEGDHKNSLDIDARIMNAKLELEGLISGVKMTENTGFHIGYFGHEFSGIRSGGSVNPEENLSSVPQHSYGQLSDLSLTPKKSSGYSVDLTKFDSKNLE